MINIETQAGITKLHERMKASREKVQPFRKNRTSDMEEYSGNRYVQDNRSKNATIGNFIHQFVEQLVLRLIGGEIKALASTPIQALKATKNRFQNALNTIIKQIHLTETSRDIVFDSAFGLGIAKTYMAEGRGAEIEQDTWMEVGFPHTRRISPDVFVWDTTQKQYSQCAFAADEYTVPWDAIRRDRFYRQNVVRKMIPETGRNLNEEQRRASDLSTGILKDPVFAEEYVTLQDVWLPENNQIAILSRYDETLGPLAVIDWTGKKEGPYDLLSLDPITDNVMPLSPTEQIQALHMTFNRLARKAISQAEDQKDVNWYTPGDKADMDRLRDTSDRGTVKITNKDGIGIMKFPGADPGLLAFMSLTESMTDRFAGNLKAKAALGPQSGTLGQDEMIQGELSSMLAQYSQRVTDFNNELVRGLAHLVWQDEANEIAGEYELPGGGTIDYPWNADYRMGDFEADYRFSVQSYSLRYESPEAKLAKLGQMLTTLLELWPAFQEAGAVLDPREVLDDFAELSNTPRIKQWIRFGRDPALGHSEPGKQAAHTTRENVRRNVSAGPTQEEGSRQMRDLLFGAMGQEAQGGPVSLGG